MVGRLVCCFVALVCTYMLTFAYVYNIHIYMYICIHVSVRKAFGTVVAEGGVLSGLACSPCNNPDLELPSARTARPSKLFA